MKSDARDLSPAGSALAADCSFAIALVVLSGLPFIGGLGFYSDDWAWLSYLTYGLNGNGAGLLDFPDPTRPIQWFNYVAQFALFGTSPLGYHLINLLVLAAGAALLLLALRELGLPRTVALAVTLIYASSPAYSTNRFWFSACQVPVSAAACFLCIWADARAVRAGETRRNAWRLAALAGLVVSVLTYEIFLPLLVMAPLLALFRAGGERRIGPAVVNWLLIVALVGAKIMLSIRLPGVPLADHFAWFARFLAGTSVAIAFGDLGLALPLTVARLLSANPDPRIIGAGLLAGVAVFGYLVRVGLRQDPGPRTLPAVLVTCGALIFVTGYAVFFVAMNAETPLVIGMSNRLAMAATLGVALVVAGAFVWLGSLVPRGARDVLTAALVATTCAANVIVLGGLGAWWVAAARVQATTLERLHHDVPRLPRGATLLLDGVCPYLGPSTVFESYWDFSGALQLAYGDATLRGDVVTSKLRVTEEGVYSQMYVPVGPHAYRDLLVYDVTTRSVRPLPGPGAVRRQLELPGPGHGRDCVLLRQGRGEARTIADLAAFGAAHLRLP